MGGTGNQVWYMVTDETLIETQSSLWNLLSKAEPLDLSGSCRIIKSIGHTRIFILAKPRCRLSLDNIFYILMIEIRFYP